MNFFRGTKAFFSDKHLLFILLLLIISTVLFIFVRIKSFQNGKSIPTASCQQGIANENFTIKLISRQFLPGAEIDSGLKWLGSYPGERAHVFLQFCEPKDKNIAGDLNIKLLNYIPDNTWFASIPREIVKDKIAISRIRWFGPIMPEDKISPSILQGVYPSYVLRDDNNVALEVSFFEDVDLKEASAVIENSGGKIIGSTPISNKLTIEIAKDLISELAKNDIVRWIDILSPPPRESVEK